MNEKLDLLVRLTKVILQDIDTRDYTLQWLIGSIESLSSVAETIYGKYSKDELHDVAQRVIQEVW